MSAAFNLQSELHFYISILVWRKESRPRFPNCRIVTLCVTPVMYFDDLYNVNLVY